jgi:hypothetical protein
MAWPDVARLDAARLGPAWPGRTWQAIGRMAKEGGHCPAFFFFLELNCGMGRGINPA